MRYFRKEIPEQAVLIFGQPFRFDFLATEDPALISELDKCVRKQVGGVISITQEEHAQELSKKNTETLLQNSSQPHRQELKAPLNLPQPDRRAVEVVANPGGRRNGMFARPQMGDRGIGAHHGGRHEAPMPDPIQIPSPAQFVVPPTAKIGEMKK